MTLKETSFHLARLLKEYFWDSKHRYQALLMLLGLILGILISITLTVIFTGYISIFFTALSTLNAPLFISSIEIMLSTLIGSSVIQYLNTYISGIIANNWRVFLTEKLLDQYSQDNCYLGLTRQDVPIEGLEVTPVDSIREFVDLTLSLGKDLLEKILTLPIYLRILWILGGTLSFLFLGVSISIPGYLVFAAILFTITTSIVSNLIGHALKDWLNKNINSEANMRREVTFIHENAESIALTQTIDIHRKSLINESLIIQHNSAKITKIKAGIHSFYEFCQPLAFIFPYVIASPLYFMQKITEEALFSLGYAFGQVYYSLSWFVDSYELLSKYTTSLTRIIELEEAIANQKTQNTQNIQIKISTDNTLRIENLSIKKNNADTGYIIQNLNLNLDSQTHTFIRGESGVGKSTLFKVIARTWSFGQGTLSFPANYRPCFLPQTPVMPPNYTLKQLLNYNNSRETYTDDEYAGVLTKTGMDQFIKDLDRPDCDWVRTLSGGQKQTLSFARVLLKKEKPTVIFLDESTSAMDSERQALMYQLLGELKDTKIVSISHHPSVLSFHNEIVDIRIDAERSAIVTTTMT